MSPAEPAVRIELQGNVYERDKRGTWRFLAPGQLVPVELDPRSARNLEEINAKREARAAESRP